MSSTAPRSNRDWFPGPVLSENRTIGAISNTISYTYNQDGSLATITYPSGRVVTYATSGAGRALSAIDVANNVKYATQATYTPAGALAGLRNGETATSSGIVTANTFNNRLQPASLTATNPGGAAVLSLTYNFNWGNANNGNVLNILNNRDHTRDQSLSYDELNRLKAAQTDSSQWGNSYVYDIWGNLLQKNLIAGKLEGESLQVTVNAKNQMETSYCYDIAGNLVKQAACPIDPLAVDYVFDAENRVKTAGGVTYTYDGDGERVKKSSGKLYWSGMGSDPLVETSDTGTILEEYIFLNGKRVARQEPPAPPSTLSIVHYYFSDHLGSADVITSAAGGIEQESDYYPFGGERSIVAGPNNYKFTGKERDSETGLDYFGARYMSSAMGRFMTPDSTSYSGLTNPQSWNLYAYTLNNPLKYNDPTGHAVECKTSSSDCLKAAQASVVNKEAASRLYINTVKTTTQHSFLGIKWTTTTTRNFIGIKGDVGSFAKLGENAGKLAGLVSNSRVFGLSISSTASPTYTGLFNKIISGGAETPLHGGGQTYTTSQGAEPEVFVDPASSDAIDSDAKRDGIPGANLGEKTAHELLGHLYSEEIAGNKAGTAQNKQDSIRSENVVRATDPSRGQKTAHHD